MTRFGTTAVIFSAAVALLVANAPGPALAKGERERATSVDERRGGRARRTDGRAVRARRADARFSQDARSRPQPAAPAAPPSGALFPKPRIRVGNFPFGTALGDLDGDGALDLVVAIARADEIAILLGRGDGSFGDHKTLALDTPGFPLIADLNADGQEDVVVTSYGDDAISVFLGNGDGTLAPRKVLPAGDGPAAIARGDLNRDGAIDLAVANRESGDVAVFIGRGDGTFEPASTFGAGNRATDLAVSDLDNDGNPDLAVAIDPQRTWILLGRGDGTFAPGEELDSAQGNCGGAVAIGDLDDDGDQDLVIGDSETFLCDKIGVLMGRGDGTFSAPDFIDHRPGAQFLELADVDGDARLDIVVPDRLGSVSILAGRGDGTFAPRNTFAAGSDPNVVALGDVDGDATLDLVAANSRSFDLSVLLGVGGGMFDAPPVVDPGEREQTAITVADLNADGVPDLVVSARAEEDDRPGFISVLLGRGDGGFEPERTFEAGSFSNDVTVDDFDADGRLDVAVDATDAVSVLVGTGDGGFGAQRTFPAGDSPVVVASSDLDGDGAIDLAVANATSDDVTVLLGRGDGTFGPPEAIALGDSPEALEIADFDEDGVADLAVLTEAGVSMLLGNGNATFGSPSSIPLDERPQAMAVADIDRDGHRDLAVVVDSPLGSEKPYSDTIALMLGRGDGSFERTDIRENLVSPDAIAVGDFSADGMLDLAVLSALGNSVDLLLGDGEGRFTYDARYPAGNPLWLWRGQGLTAGDFDLDGRLDLATPRAYSEGAHVLVNQLPDPVTRCAVLGDGDNQRMRDVDVYTFEGRPGEHVKVSLEASTAGVGRASLLVAGPSAQGRTRVWSDRTVLPNELAFEVRDTGEHRITIVEQSNGMLMAGDIFRGAYCVTIEVLPAWADPGLEPTSTVEGSEAASGGTPSS